MSDMLKTAIDRIRDMLKGDDGQAFKEAEKFIEQYDLAVFNAAPTLCEQMQKKCWDWGIYWRAPDAHGVTPTIEQAAELLAFALGVEVEIKAKTTGNSEEPFAWYAPQIDDTCTHAKKAQRERDLPGTARLFTVPLYAHAPEKLDTGNWADDPLYKALDALYERGWEDYPKKKHDPRGTKQWDAVLFMFRDFRDKPEEVVTRKMVRSMRKILKERWQFHIGAEAARDVLTAAIKAKSRA